MNHRTLCFLFFLFIYGCATYKELNPIPEIVPVEGYYQQIKNKDENFLLEKNNKYVIKFPRPPKNDFYLMLVGYKKPIIYATLENYFDADVESVLTRSFGFREGKIQKIPDKVPNNDTVSLYPIDSMSSYYVWKIDTVKRNVELVLSYRYVYQWRYTFETEYEKLHNILNLNLADRTEFQKISVNYDINSIDLSKEINIIEQKRNKLKKVREDLKNLEKIIPKDVKESNDTAYVTYLSFCDKVNNEIVFQDNYLSLLYFFKKENITKGDVGAFLKEAPMFTNFVNDELPNMPKPIQEKVVSMLSNRLDEIIPFYENELRKKDIYDITLYPEIDNAENLFRACKKTIPIEYVYLCKFVKVFNAEKDALINIKNNLADLNTIVDNVVGEQPTESFYKMINSILEQSLISIPESRSQNIEKYGKYKNALLIDHNIENAKIFIDQLKSQFLALQVMDNKIREIDLALSKAMTWPSDTFYLKIINAIEDIKRNTPKSTPTKVDPYSDSKIVLFANKRISQISKFVNDSQPRFQKAALLVPQINELKSQSNYRGIIKLLNSNKNLGFLITQYPDIDSLSLYSQVEVIVKHLSTNEWENAELKISDLYNDNDFVYSVSFDKKNILVKKYENELYDKVNQLTRTAVETFIKNNEAVYTNVSQLYKDSAFIPVYKMKFSSSGQKDLMQKNKQIENYIAEMKYLRFPETSIKTIYKDLIRNIRDNGVEKARAIVEHGKYYKGSDKQIKGLIEECDYSVPKLLTKTSEYRKLYALPSTNNRKGKNEYIVRVNLKIPSDAEFPVYDINITVPPELVKGDESIAWYDEISINKKVIKSEGRFHITAPTSLNNYESIITPIQIDKSQDNIFEIRFTYEGFRIFEMSIMAQKPLIRK